MRQKLIRIFIFLQMLPYCLPVYADGSNIDIVYDPYVQLLEKEIEFRTLYEQDSKDRIDGSSRYRLGYGEALSDQWFVELYLTATDDSGSNLKLEAYELELKWQITEQGEYENDWGLLFELEKEHNDNIWEASPTLILLHEWSEWVATGNFSVIYEWGKDIDNEWETAFAGQLRYRNNEKVEAGIELYQSQDTQSVGPVLMGLLRMGNGKKLKWGIGAILGTNKDTADINWKFNLEYEFQ